MKTINLSQTRKIKDEIAHNPNNVMSIIENEKEMGICITDHKGVFVAVSERYLQIYGWNRSELIRKHFTEVVPAEYKKKLSDMHDMFIKNKYEIIRNWEVQKKDKSLIKIQADAGWSDAIFDKKPHKITFVQPVD